MKNGNVVINNIIFLIKVVNFIKIKVLGCMDRFGDKDRYDKLISKEKFLNF